ncbi:serine hydrolase [Bernardetia sp. ABR2-2B]|uniref:serine hydrolase n=1 Tax=Bernardetia sp. ABR2-2B TaxID=3127472 RepID=UPI0030D2A0F6
MKNNLIFLYTLLLLFLNPLLSNACSMYKISKDGKTIVGNNEDWVSPNSQFWFESGNTDNYGVMYMGLLDNFAQGAINEAGLVFDGFANPELPVNNTEGKTDIPIGRAIRKIMQTMDNVEEVKEYLSKINLSSLSSSQIVFVDKSGAYLIVEGDELIIGEDKEKIFSNFYYSQIKSEKDIKLENVQCGLKFIKSSKANASLDYCSEVMKSLSSSKTFGTQYSTIYNLNTLKVRVYLFHDYSTFIELDLIEELKKGNHRMMIADLFSKESVGNKHYQKYNDKENPTRFLKELVDSSEDITEKELQEMGFNNIINMIGYEWLNDNNNPQAAIKVFDYGTTLMPSDANLFDSFGEAYFENNNYEKAKINYEKSLALNPKNKGAKKFIERINLKIEQQKKFKKLQKIIDQYAQNTLKKGNINSLAISVYKNEEMYHNYYGEIDTNANNSPTDSTLYEVASISKVFVGSLVAKAVVEGKITLEDDIRMYFENDFSNLEFEGTPIKIKNLLTHTLGLKNRTPKKLEKINEQVRAGYYENKEFDYDTNDLLEELETAKLDKKPGTFYEYNLVGSELLTCILSKVYEKPYKELLEDFFDELGMRNSYLQEYEKQKDYIINGYGEDKKQVPLLKNTLPGGAYGVLSTLPDLTKFMQFQLESKNPLIEESTRFLFENEEESIGYLWDVGVEEVEGFYYSKTGTSNGVQSVILVCPESDYGLILMMNNTSDAAFNDWVNLYNKIETDLIQYPKLNLVSLLKTDFIENPKKAQTEYRRLKSDTTNYAFGSNYLNRFGYELLFNNQTKKAIEIFEFAISEDPKNANLYDSLGEAYFNDNDYKKALLNYKISLELNPNNKNAKDYISRINKLESNN